MTLLLSIGVGCTLFLLGAFLLSLRNTKRVTLVDRIVKQPVQEHNEQKEDSYLVKLEKNLAHGRTDITVPVYFMIMLVSAVLIFVAANFLTESTVAAAIASIFAVYIPGEIVEMIATSKKQEENLMCCKALKRMAASLRTGSTLPQAVEEVALAPSMPAFIREEMQKVRTDYEYESSMEAAFQSMYERTGVEAIKGVALAIEISSSKGTKLYETFENYAQAILKRTESEAEAKAALAEKRSEINILVLIPFLFAAAFKLISPDFFDPLTNLAGGLGKYLVLAIYGYVIVGYLVCRKKMAVKVGA